MHVHEFSLLSIWFIYWRTHFSAPEMRLFAFWDYLSFLVLASSHSTPSATLPCPPWLVIPSTFSFLCACVQAGSSAYRYCVLSTPTTPISNSHASFKPNSNIWSLPFTSCLSLSYTSQANFCHTILYVHLSLYCDSVYVENRCLWFAFKIFYLQEFTYQIQRCFPLTHHIHIKIHLQATVTRKEFCKISRVFFFSPLDRLWCHFYILKAANWFPSCHQEM